MQLRPFVRLCCSVSLLLGFLYLAAAAQTSPADNKDAQPGDFERLAEIFGPPGSPSIKGKTWVAVDTGPENWPSELHGWLIEDGAKDILLLDWYGDLYTLRKPASDEKRPKIQEEKDGGLLWSTIQEADCSVVWKVRAEDYNAKSRKFLAQGLPKDRDANNAWEGVSQRFGLADHVVDATRFAHYAYQLGQKAHAADLHAHARVAHEKYADRYIVGRERAEAIHLFVADRIASTYRNVAICSAHGGTSRRELQKQWERIAAIPHHKYRNEAKAMSKHYQTLLEEDARWVEPDAKAFAKMTTDQKIAYWLYHLRDLDVGQWSDPGSCYVLGRFGFGFGNAEKEKPNAAVALRKLGMAAVPQLIAHLDDARPTRCKGHWRSYWPEGHYLLRYGDCCQQVFESITGHTIFRGTTTVSYPIHDGKQKQCKEKAEKWWQEYQEKTRKPG